MRRILTVAIFLAVCAPLSACGSAAKSKATLRGRIVAAALAQKSVHYTMAIGAPGERTALTADVAADSGTERVTIPAGDIVEVRLVNDTIYFRGGYEGGIFLGLTSAQAARYADRWIAVTRGHRPYRALALGLTFDWIVRHAVPRRPLEKSFQRKPDGTRLLVLSPPTGAGVPYDPPFAYMVTARASELLPVASSYFLGGIAKHGIFSSRRFSKWNEPVSVEVPASSTPIATVRAS